MLVLGEMEVVQHKGVEAVPGHRQRFHLYVDKRGVQSVCSESWIKTDPPPAQLVSAEAKCSKSACPPPAKALLLYLQTPFPFLFPP